MKATHHENPTDKVSDLQYITGLEYLTRARLYQYAETPIGQLQEGGPYYGIHGEIIRALNLSGEETMADIGCGNGSFHLTLLEQGHKGELVGVNKTEAVYMPTRHMLSDSENPNLRFMQGDARELPLESDSIDVLTENFLLYHISNYMRALEEAKRVLRPGGTIAISTRSTGNHQRLWELYGNVVTDLQEQSKQGQTEKDYTKLVAPKSFYEHFDFDKAWQALVAAGFTDVNLAYRQTGELHIPAEGWEDYKMALISLRTASQANDQLPGGGDTMQTIDKIVKPVFDHEVLEKGYFTDYVDQGVFTANKPLLNNTHLNAANALLRREQT